MEARSNRPVRIGLLADGFGEPDLADAIAIQIQLRKSLGRKPPIQDACLPFRPYHIPNFLRRSPSRNGSRPILYLVTVGSYDDINWMRFCARHETSFTVWS
jgi:hypothetical protein